MSSSILYRIEDGIVKVEDGLVYALAGNPLMKFCQRWAERVLYRNAFLVCLLLLVLFAIISFSPLVMHYHDASNFVEERDGWEYYRRAVGSEMTKKWVLVSVFSAIPMGLELVLDYRRVFEGPEEKLNWLATLVLISALIAPGVIIYCLASFSSDQGLSDAALLVRFTLVRFQFLSCLFGMLAMMFGRRVVYPRNEKHKLLNFSVEKRSVNALVLAVLSRLFDTYGRGEKGRAVTMLGRILATLSVLSVFLLAIRMIYLLSKHYLKYGRFSTHHHISDFIYASATMLYIGVYYGVQTSALFSTPSSTSEAEKVILWQTLIQVALACFVQIISGRKNKRLAEIKHEKLETRLNLIRYVSHEMRTPLNTAFMGLTLVTNDLKAWRRILWGTENSEEDPTQGPAVRKGGENLTTRRQRHDQSLMQQANPLIRSPTLNLQSNDRRSQRQFEKPSITQIRIPSTECEADLMQDSFDRADDLIPDRNLSQERVFNNQPRNVSPLNALRSFDSRAISEALDTLTQVNDSCQVALSTLDDLLTFDKIDEQKLVVEMQDISPWSFVCAAAKPFSINAKQTHVHFAVKLHDRESGWARRHMIRGDPFKLSQVLRNLISNALKFTPAEGNVEVRVQRDPDFNNKDIVRISVTDTGAGISPQNQKKLFGQYVQFNAGALQQGKGSGLGLWISKSIVEMHEGQIGVVSEGEGCGSMFYVDLPLVSKAETTRASIRRQNSLRSPIHDRRSDTSSSGNHSRQDSDAEQLVPSAALDNVDLNSSNRILMIRRDKVDTLWSWVFRKPYSKSQSCDAQREDVWIDDDLESGSVVSRAPSTFFLNHPVRLWSKAYQQCASQNGQEVNHAILEAVRARQLANDSSVGGRPVQDNDGLNESEGDADDRFVSPFELETNASEKRSPKSGTSKIQPICCESFDNEDDNVNSISSILVTKPQSSGSSCPPSHGQATRVYGLGSFNATTPLSLSGNNDCLIDGQIVREGMLERPDSCESLEYDERPIRSRPSPLPSYQSLRAYSNASDLSPGFFVRPNQPLSEGIEPNRSIRNEQLNILPQIDQNPSPLPHHGWERSLKILLVDDALSNRKLCSKLLTSHGHVVLDAHDGQHGLEVWQEHQRLYGSMSGNSESPPHQQQEQVQQSGHGQFLTNSNGNGSTALTGRPFDLILLDDNMPRLAGFQTAQALRKLGYKGLIIGVTGDVHEEAVQRFLSHGADHVLSKPLDIEKLRTWLNCKIDKL
eukprot:gene3832-4185_t